MKELIEKLTQWKALMHCCDVIESVFEPDILSEFFKLFEEVDTLIQKGRERMVDVADYHDKVEAFHQSSMALLTTMWVASFERCYDYRRDIQSIIATAGDRLPEDMTAITFTSLDNISNIFEEEVKLREQKNQLKSYLLFKEVKRAALGRLSEKYSEPDDPRTYKNIWIKDQ